MQKLYGLYLIVDNKTVRQHEKFYRFFKNHNKDVPGRLVKTNRGYFIDGKHVDVKSAAMFFFGNGYNKEARELTSLLNDARNNNQE